MVANQKGLNTSTFRGMTSFKLIGSITQLWLEQEQKRLLIILELSQVTIHVHLHKKNLLFSYSSLSLFAMTPATSNQELTDFHRMPLTGPLHIFISVDKGLYNTNTRVYVGGPKPK